jgi:serine/threonine protein kinase
LDGEFHLKLTDFGSARDESDDSSRVKEPPPPPPPPPPDSKQRDGNSPIEERGCVSDFALENRSTSFVGTAEYIPPELIINKYVDRT